MHKRPSLPEAIKLLKKYESYSEDCKSALTDYYRLKQIGEEFLAARMVVDIVDHFNHSISVKNIEKSKNTI